MTNKGNIAISNKRAIVACDLFLSLRLYHLPEWLQERLKVSFPNVEIIPVNTQNSPLVEEKATVYWGNRITAEIIDSMPKLEWIHFGSVGINRVNTKNLTKRKILITSSKGLVISSMVASAIAFMTNLARGIHFNQILRNQNNMNRESFDNYFDQIHELSDECCLIVGFGDVGKRLAKVCKALEMNVSIISRSVKKHKYVDDTFILDNLSDAVSKADYVINLLPLNSETDQVFTNQVFTHMKNSAFFINIGRGETVDEEALILALENKKIMGAGLDVFSQEPLNESSPLWRMENVILSPHIAGLSKGYWDRQADLFIKNLKHYLEGDNTSMDNIVNMNSKGVFDE
jgi:phosphoglycerate dehydrogenase-like enzyme